MANGSEDRRRLLEREVELWRTQGESAQKRLDDLRPNSPEAGRERDWLDHCFRRHEEAAVELDRVSYPQKYAGADARHTGDHRDWGENQRRP